MIRCVIVSLSRREDFEYKKGPADCFAFRSFVAVGGTFRRAHPIHLGLHGAVRIEGEQTTRRLYSGKLLLHVGAVFGDDRESNAGMPG